LASVGKQYRRIAKGKARYKEICITFWHWFAASETSFEIRIRKRRQISDTVYLELL